MPESEPTTGYRTLLADPPWDIQQKGSLGAVRHYPVMALEAICDLRPSRLCAPDAHLWLWVTNASLHAGKTVIEAWGFSYRSCLTWIKPQFGLGNYLRNQTEHLLLGTRGTAPVLFKGQGTWFHAPLQEHSHKPEAQYAVIERCSPGPCLELFAGRSRRGWDTRGQPDHLRRQAMRFPMYPKSWQRNLWEAVALLLAVTIAAHFIWDELKGLLPLLVALVVLAVVYTLVLRGWRR